MTDLEAVNQMLRTIGQVPVPLIPDSGFSDARVAYEVLLEYTNELQSDGYDFNLDEDKTVSPDVNGEIIFSSATQSVSNYRPYPRLSLRGRKLYNHDDSTFIFDSNQQVNVVTLVGFEELPLVLQRYVVIRASRVFSNRVIGAQEINSYTAEDEARARNQWLNTIAQTMQLNVMSNTTHHRPSTFRPINAINRGYNL